MKYCCWNCTYKKIRIRREQWIISWLLLAQLYIQRNRVQHRANYGSKWHRSKLFLGTHTHRPLSDWNPRCTTSQVNWSHLKWQAGTKETTSDTPKIDNQTFWHAVTGSSILGNDGKYLYLSLFLSLSLSLSLPLTLSLSARHCCCKVAHKEQSQSPLGGLSAFWSRPGSAFTADSLTEETTKDHTYVLSGDVRRGAKEYM